MNAASCVDLYVVESVYGRNNSGIEAGLVVEDTTNLNAGRHQFDEVIAQLLVGGGPFFPKGIQVTLKG